MNDSAGMRFGQAPGNLVHDAERRLLRYTPLAPDFIPQCYPFHVFHDDEVNPLDHVDGVNLDDIGMTEFRDSFRFLEKELCKLLSARKIGEQNLDGHETLELGIRG